MSDSTFDPTVFENMVIEAENETVFTPVPEGDYPAIIDGVDIASIDIKNGARAGTTVPILRVTYHIQDEDGSLTELLKREKITVRQDVWLDVINGALAFGPNQNVGLGKLREACDMNTPGQPFSFKMLEGYGPLTATVTHREGNGGVVYDQVSRAVKPDFSES